MSTARDPASWIGELTPQEFTDTIRDRFEFLMSVHGFGAPVLEHNPLTLHVAYAATRVGVEVTVDLRDRAVEVNLVRLADGEVPKGWMLDAAGRRIRIRLYEAASFRGLPSLKASSASGETPRAKLRTRLDRAGDQLRQDFADVLDDSDQLFRDLDEARASRNEEKELAAALSGAREAFRAQDYGRVIDLLRPVERRLSPAQAKMLSYAHEKAGG